MTYEHCGGTKGGQKKGNSGQVMVRGAEALMTKNQHFGLSINPHTLA